jgi:hypothetical protein
VRRAWKWGISQREKRGSRGGSGYRGWKQIVSVCVHNLDEMDDYMHSSIHSITDTDSMQARR